MTTAQDQQSRAEFEAWAVDKFELHRQSGDRYSSIHTQSAWESWQAARALPAPENVREGEPYDNPAFEDLARSFGVWGTAQSALCAQFFLAGRGALPAAPLQEPDEPAGWIEATGERYYTSAQVLAMGRVPPTPAEIERLAVKHEAFGFGQVDSKGLTTHGFDPDGLAAFVNDLFAAATRPPEA